MVSNTNHVGYIFDPEKFGILLDPSPFSLLASCLLLGCSISSFAHRRQGHDQCQSLIFVFAILTAATIGFGLRINANLIMLGFIPWALIFAMISSVFIHWTVRHYSKDRKLLPLFFLENGGKPTSHWLWESTAAHILGDKNRTWSLSQCTIRYQQYIHANTVCFQRYHASTKNYASIWSPNLLYSKISP